MKQAVCALIYTKSGNVIGVSRKDNPTAFGLIGGKVDEGETPEQALVRETFEETGLTIMTCERIFQRIDGDFICFTYLCTAEGEITTTESGVVKEVTWMDLFIGPFGYYNLELYKHLKTL